MIGNSATAPKGSDGFGDRAASGLAGGSHVTLRSPASSGPTPWRPEIAIVTITKDDPSGIRRTIASVEQQDFRLYEHVVVNGGSSTDVADWLASWREADPDRHLLVDNPPAGIYPAMNAGIQSTSAALVVVLNGGDQLLSGTLRRVSDHYKENGWRWAYGGLEGRDANGRSLGEITFSPFSRYSFRAGLAWIPHPAAYVTRDLYGEVGLYRDDLGNGADQEFFLRASLVADPGQLPGILAAFATGGVSSQESRIGREISWHRMRLASKTAFGGHPATDLFVTTLILVRRFFSWGGRKIQRNLCSLEARRH